ncbi:Manganese transporter smf1 [Coemansia sp. RSA 2399]|nr:Manganese transporter smf1 [Coemansia sp. RSA 2399]KAJ1908466.1 Manganese transporter smf1 [Coemansia sp. IMI 209127]
MSSTFTPVNPRPFLQSLVGKPIVARLKWGQEYKGLLASADSYMNVQLINAEEFQDGNSAGELPGELLIRCNNILYIREIALDGDEPMGSGAHEQDDVDAHMEDGEQDA